MKEYQGEAGLVRDLRGHSVSDEEKAQKVFVVPVPALVHLAQSPLSLPVCNLRPVLTTSTQFRFALHSFTGFNVC